MDAPIRKIGYSKRRNSLGQKQCSACDEWLESCEFAPKLGISDGLQSKCKKCLQRYNRSKVYGIAPSSIDDMYADQGGRCAVCANLIDPNGCHVDHDHKCCPGYKSCGLCVRGLLCGRCNLMLGMAKDSVDLLNSAVSYLEGSSL